VLEYPFFWSNLILMIVTFIIVYYYSIKTYGLKTILIVNLVLSSFVLLIIITGSYSAADLRLPPYFKGNIGGTEFHLTDPISIFPIFMIILELGRISWGKMKGDPLSNKDVIIMSIIVSIFGLCYQPIMDLTSAAVGYYYYQNPPVINIFGYPIWFLMSFGIYGLYALIFLMFEKYYS